MSLNEATLSRQLGRAKDDLTAWNKALETNGVPSSARRKNTKWRQLNAAYNAIRNRLKAAEAIRTRDEGVAQHKVEKLAAAAAEKNEPKKVAKQPKAAAKPKKEKSTEPKEKKKKEDKKES